jgi:hypothetical protein
MTPEAVLGLAGHGAPLKRSAMKTRLTFDVMAVGSKSRCADGLRQSGMTACNTRNT